MLETRTELWQASARLTRIVRTVKRARTGAPRCLSLGRLVSVDLEQQGEKPGVLQKGVAHWDRLLVW